MHDEQHPSQRVAADDGLARFFGAGGVHQPEEGIEEHFGRAFKGDATMDCHIETGFLLVPDKGSAVEFVANIHLEKMA